MDNKDILELLDKYNDGTCSEEERSLIETWYLQYENKQLQDLTEPEREDDLSAIWASLPVHSSRPRYIFWITRISAAAIVLLIGVSAWFILNEGPIRQQVVYKTAKEDVSPGGNKATLTLANGNVIVLDDAGDGEIAKQNGTSILKTANGKLIYAVDGEVRPATEKLVGINTIETPRGGQYQLELPDKTKVWLNAESSLRYPTSFTGKERKVELTGEAYFEVAHNKNMPFRVIGNNQIVEVLGTHFNIDAYPDERVIKTSLLEGSVRVFNLTSNISNLLIPGQQAVLSEGNIKIAAVDLEEVTAWKNGFIAFENEKITSLMKKISRWYDVEIIYQGKITNNDFNGSVSRFESVYKVLEILEATKAVHFKIEGRRIIVMQ